MKLFSKLATAFVGMAMAIGVGVAVSGNNSKEVRAAEGDTHEISSFTGKDEAILLNNGGTPDTISLSDQGYYVKQVIIGWQHNKSNNGVTASVSVGGNSLGTGKVGGQSTTTTTTIGDGNTSLSGAIEITWTNGMSGTGKGTLYLRSLTLVEGSGAPLITYTITYDANGGTGTMEDTTNTVAACTFTAPEGKTFSTWNTSASGSGTDYAPGDTAESDLDLYAIWADKPACVTLEDIGVNAPDAYSSELDTLDILDGSDTYTLNFVNGKKQNSAMILQKSSGAFISNHTEIPGSITSVELFINTGASGSATYDVAFGTSEYTTATAGIGAVNITAGNSHVFENASVDDATYFCVTLGANYNGQVLKIVINYETSSEPKLVIKDTSQEQGPFELVYNSSDKITLTAWAEGGAAPLTEGLTWSFSNETTVYHVENVNVVDVTPKNVGSVDVTVSHAGYKNATSRVTVTPGNLEQITVSGSMTKTSYYVGETWSSAGLSATAIYDSGHSETVTDKAVWSWNPAAPATSVVSVTPAATYGGVTGYGSAQSVSVTRTNPIQVLYTTAALTDVEVWGRYVGFLDGTGPVIMDGAYGIVLFAKDHDVSGYTVNETVLHVNAKLTVFNGLYELGGKVGTTYYNPAISVETDASKKAEIEMPVIYATHGGETQEYASRLTTVTGTAVVTSGSFESDAGTADIKMDFTVGSQTVQVFYKKAAQTADADAFAAMKSAVADSTEITIKGFTGWYNGFQVQMNGYIPPAEGYTAEDFAQDLLDQTDAVCAGYDGVTDNHDEIEAIWTNLASNDKYPSLPSAEKTILAEAERDESGTVVEQAMARYDYLTGKYSLSNFINGRTPVAFAAPSTVTNNDNNINSSMSVVVVAVIAIASLSAIGVLLVIKRRKSI